MICPLILIVTKDDPLHNVPVLKILGVHLLSSLKWNEYVNTMTRKATQRLYILRNLKISGSSFSVLRNAI